MVTVCFASLLLCNASLSSSVGLSSDSEREQESFIDALSRSSDYISSLTVMALSAEGINWPTSAWLHNALPSTGSLLKH